jgi:protein CWC15
VLQAAEQSAQEAKEKEKELMTGNPLLALGQDVSFSLKRRWATSMIVLHMQGLHTCCIICYRWDEDVVFKNQARSEPKSEKRFINDTIRNDFHKRFLSRYIR